MNAEIIAVGSEMLGLSRIDTNSLHLTAELNKLGVEVVAKYVVGDDRDRLAGAVRTAMGRSAILILSGGLGPTEDDVTREAVAQALGRQLVYNPEVASWIERRFTAAHRRMAEINRRQAYVIEGAEVLPNDRGTAPGLWLEENGAVAALLPGPPHELKAMFELQCLPRLRRIVPPLAIRTLFWRVAGMGESDLDALIAPVYKKYENPVTTILAAAGDIQIHLRARCATEAEADALLAEVAGPMAEILGDRVYSRNGDPLESVVAQMLLAQGATVSVAESVTAGLVADKLASARGSQEFFLGGFIAHTEAMQRDLLGVPAGLLSEQGAASRAVAEAMALGARQRTGSTYAVAVTGAAGPEPAGDVPKGTMFAALAGPDGTHVVRRQFLGDRQRIRTFVVQMALDVLRRVLAGSEPQP